MLLSIGMIVKNEQKYLRQCLEGLKQILDNVDSELIIVDTGSTDDTVAIAKEFTDKVLHFEWCNDFAAARNVSLENSKGEWFMFIDGDEIIEDASEIIEFFNSGEYKKYTKATYIQRNYTDDKKDRFSDFHASRMARLSEGVRFEGIIHEYLLSVAGDKKEFGTVAHHYGYMIVSRSASRKKVTRNIDLLLEEIKTVDNPLRTCLHLSQAYYVIRDYNEAEKYMLMAINAIESKKLSNYDKRIDYAIYLQTAKQYSKANKHEKALNILKKYFKLKKHNILLDIEAYGIMMLSSFKMSSYKECIFAYEKYKQLYSLHQQGKLSLDGSTFFSTNGVNEANFMAMRCIAARAYVGLEDYEGARSILIEMQFEDFTGDEPYVINYINAVFLMMTSAGDYSGAESIINHQSSKVRIAVESFISTNNEDHPGLLEYLSKKELSDEKYSQMLNIKVKSDNGEDVSELLKQFADGFTYNKSYSDILYYMLKHKVSIKDIIKIDGFCNMISGLDALLEKETAVINIVREYIDSIEEVENFAEVSFGFGLYNFLLDNAEKISDEDLRVLFDEYIDFADGYISIACNADMVNDECISGYPANIQFAYFASRAIEYYDENKFIEVIRYLKKALRADGEKKFVINMLLEEVKQKTDENKSNADNEFNEYAKKIKTSITQLLNNGDIVNARAFIQAYKKVNSADAEIEHLEKRLELLENNK